MASKSLTAKIIHWPPLHSEGHGRYALWDRVGDKSGTSTVTSQTTWLSCSPLCGLTGPGEIYLPGSGAVAKAANS